MWTPKQLLHDDVIQTLREHGFGESQLEFLGWLSYNATALNNSRNPTKAAHTILAKEKMEKMVAMFMSMKKESVRPKERPEHDKVDRLFNQLDKWVEHVEANTQTPREPDAQDKLDAADDESIN